MAMDILIHGTLTAWLTLSVWHRVATFRLGKSRQIFLRVWGDGWWCQCALSLHQDKEAD